MQPYKAMSSWTTAVPSASTNLLKVGSSCTSMRVMVLSSLMCTITPVFIVALRYAPLMSVVAHFLLSSAAIAATQNSDEVEAVGDERFS